MPKASPIVVFDTTVHVDQDGRFSLNDIHKAAMAKGMASHSQKPGNFLKSADVQRYISRLDSDDTKIASVIIRKGGKHQGSYGIRAVALRYAAWIDKSLETEVYRIIERVIDADESLTADLIDRQTDTAAQKRLAARAQGKVVRHALTDTLADHGVTGYGYARCTDAVYMPILGAPAKQLRQTRQLPAKANVREHMSMKELAAVMLSEEIAAMRVGMPCRGQPREVDTLTITRAPLSA